MDFYFESHNFCYNKIIHHQFGTNVMLKPLILASICGVLSSAVLAKTPLTPYTELTNLDTQGYVWKVEFRANPQGQFDAKLSNQHPKLAVLNKRVIEIAENYKHKLQDNKNSIISSKANYTLASDGKTKIYQEPYVLKIDFPLLRNEQNIHWKRKPNVLDLERQGHFICKKLGNVQQITINWLITTQLDGKIIDAQLIQNPEYNDDTHKLIYNIMSRIILRASLLPRNKDGVPYAIRANQPFEISCPTPKEVKEH